MKNSFNTQSYKSGFIHSHYDPEIGLIIRVQFKDHSQKPVKTFTGAKRMITKYEKSI